MNAITWLTTPEAHDYPAAQSYLNLLLTQDQVDQVVKSLQSSSITFFKAKDILRASKLAALTADNHHVARDLGKMKNGGSLSPVLLVRGALNTCVPVTIADGYHRICAAYLFDEDGQVPAKVAELPF